MMLVQSYRRSRDCNRYRRVAGRYRKAKLRSKVVLISSDAS